MTITPETIQLIGTLLAVGLASSITLDLTRLVVFRWRHENLARDARLIEISAPPEADLAGADEFWRHLPGLLRPAWKRRLLGQPHIAFELHADASGVRTQVWVPGTIPADLIEKAITSAWPGASVATQPAGPSLPPDSPVIGGRLLVGRADCYPLRTGHDTDPLRAQLGVLSGLKSGKYAVVQVLARPVTGARLGRAHRAAAALRGGRSASLHGQMFDLLTPGHGHISGGAQPYELARMFPERAAQVKAILDKAAQPRFEVEIRYGAAAPQREALRGMAHRLASAFALFTSAHQYLRRRRLWHPAYWLASRRLDQGYLLSAGELAAIAHLPLDADAPGITRAGARPVPPSPAIPQQGTRARPVRVLGDADGGHVRPVALSVADTRHHVHVLGETGVGKSTLLANLILADADQGRGGLVIDPKGDLVTDILDRLPEKVINHTVVFDPCSTSAPPSVNVLAGPEPSFAVDSIVTIFHRCFSSAWGPRVDDLLRSTCLTLTKVKGSRATLADVPQVLTDTATRNRIVGKLRDELLRGFWESYEALSPAGRAAVIGPIMNKLRAVLLRPFVRDALCRPASTVDVGKLLDGGGLILARLPKGVLGDDAARLFGSVLLAHTWQAITRRSRQIEAARPDAAIWVDECHNFLNLPGSISDVLAEARAYRISMVLAHQHLSQLPADLKDAVSADARNKIYFAVSPEDAADLKTHAGPVIGPHDLAHLGRFQAAARLVADGAAVRAFTLRTRPLPPAIPGRAEAIRAASAPKPVLRDQRSQEGRRADVRRNHIMKGADE